MKKLIPFLLLLSGSASYTQAQFLKSLGNQINNTLSGNNKMDSSNRPMHHRKGNMLDNFRNGITPNQISHDSTMKLSKEDEPQATHADLSKFNTQHFYKLQEGEKFSFYEACLLMQADKPNAQILVVKEGKPWLIGNEGQHIAVDPKKMGACPLNSRRGDLVSFNDLNGDQSDAYGDKPGIFSIKLPSDEVVLHDMGFDTAVLKKMQKSKAEGDDAAAMRQAMSMKILENGKLVALKPRTTIVFRGKTFGPYMQVNSFVFDKGAAKFLAIVDFHRPNTDLTTINGDISKLMEPWLIGSDGARIRLPDGADKIIADGDLSFVRIQVLKITPDIRDVRTSLFDPKTGKSIQILNEQSLAGNPETEQSVDKKSGNVITKQHNGQQTKFYINDKLITTLDGESDIPLSSVFVSKDASRWAVWGSKALYFSNGEKVDGVISVRVGDGNSGYSLNWIVLGNDNKTLELCHYDL